MNNEMIEREDVRELVRQRYGAAALRVLEGSSKASCCGDTADSGGCCGEASEREEACCSNAEDQITSGLYNDLEASQIPEPLC